LLTYFDCSASHATKSSKTYSVSLRKKVLGILASMEALISSVGVIAAPFILISLCRILSSFLL
jgi:hypothetical protein